MKKLRALLLGGLLAAAAFPLAAAQDSTETAAPDGAEQYRLFCQACHMSDGSGAEGAGTYPNLAGNIAVEASAELVIMRILNGYGAMPSFRSLSDGNVASIVNYVRNEFNNADEQISPGDVAGQR